MNDFFSIEFVNSMKEIGLGFGMDRIEPHRIRLWSLPGSEEFYVEHSDSVLTIHFATGNYTNYGSDEKDQVLERLKILSIGNVILA